LILRVDPQLQSNFHGDKDEAVNIPESFKVLIKELNALCLNLDLISNKSSVEEVEEVSNEEVK
jgi:DNA-directed RNA polymerase beta subunit